MPRPEKFEGLRKVFLEGERERYKQAVANGTRDDYLMDVFRRFFKRFPVGLPDDKEPSSKELAKVNDALPDPERVAPDAQDYAEDQRTYYALQAAYDEETKLIEARKKQIARWFQYRLNKDEQAKSNVKTKIKQSKAVDLQDPMTILTLRILGKDAARPRKLADYNVWARENKEKVSSAYAAAKKSQGGMDLGVRGNVARDLFRKLSPSVREAYEQKAKDEHNEMIKKFEEMLSNPPPATPESRQTCINGLANFMQPVLDRVVEATGMCVVLLAGGPEPAAGGRLNIIGLSSGRTKGTVQNTFPEAEPDKYHNQVIPAFSDFLRKCYTREDCLASRLQSTIQSQLGCLDSSEVSYTAATGENYGPDGQSATTMHSDTTASATSSITQLSTMLTATSSIPASFVATPTAAVLSTSASSTQTSSTDGSNSSPSTGISDSEAASTESASQSQGPHQQEEHSGDRGVALAGVDGAGSGEQRSQTKKAVEDSFLSQDLFYPSSPPRDLAADPRFVTPEPADHNLGLLFGSPEAAYPRDLPSSPPAISSSPLYSDYEGARAQRRATSANRTPRTPQLQSTPNAVRFSQLPRPHSPLQSFGTYLTSSSSSVSAHASSLSFGPYLTSPSFASHAHSSSLSLGPPFTSPSSARPAPLPSLSFGPYLTSPSAARPAPLTSLSLGPPLTSPSSARPAPSTDTQPSPIIGDGDSLLTRQPVPDFLLSNLLPAYPSLISNKSSGVFSGGHSGRSRDRSSKDSDKENKETTKKRKTAPSGGEAEAPQRKRAKAVVQTSASGSASSSRPYEVSATTALPVPQRKRAKVVVQTSASGSSSSSPPYEVVATTALPVPSRQTAVYKGGCSELRYNRLHLTAPYLFAQLPADCDTGIRNTLTMLTSVEWELGWDILTAVWIRFEKIHNFQSSSKKFKPTGRPQAIGDWIKRARASTYRPQIDVEKFGADFWKSASAAT
ncbi:hypothetical protein CVT26_007383 [Gymnopilus dilepis]|uniref:Uncharacterized protein n=1 Tax=Gymnopilus dilepis TaxID=231916 RepID=A0A409X0S8_9AGAR|nr:hypothetical protein CVT26_007383 [Gymnopilus dilepis]